MKRLVRKGKQTPKPEKEGKPLESEKKPDVGVNLRKG